METVDLQSARILVIDDEPSVGQMIRHLFQNCRMGTVHCTTDPREAVPLFLEVQPDLVLLDLIMPHVNGLQVLEELRACEQHADRVPIVIITSDPTIESRHTALSRGATDFLNKPFDTIEIVLRASNLLETRLLHRRLLEQNKLLAEQLRERESAEMALRETRDRSQAIIDHSPSVIFVKDRAGCYLEANRRVQEMMGMSRAELIGKTDYELPLPREAADQLREYDRQVCETGVPIRVEESVPSNGEMRVYQTVKFPLTDAQGSIYASCGIATDVTEQRRDIEMLRASEERLRTTIDSALEGIITMDAAGIVLEFNPAAETMFGYSRAEAVGHELAELIIPPPLRDRQRAGLARHQTTGAGTILNRRVELPALRADGSEIQVELTVIRVGTTDPAIFTGFVRDITARKLSEAALTAARYEAERANHAKSEFLSRMSHELRTPLNGILGFAQILEMNALQDQPGACVTHILKAGRHLLSLINEVLDLSGIEAGRVTFSIEPVRLLDAAREALDLVRPLAAPHGLRLELQEELMLDAWVVADRQRLQQVLLNLLANAVKYNREGGTVRLSWEEAPSERLRIMVSDTGPGVAPENLERLFVPFERLGAERTQVEGAGLGLSLSKKLIVAMGGEIGAESVLGTGSTFWVKLPRSSSPLVRLHEAGIPPEAVEMVQRGTILYVEDNLANLALIEYIFAQRPQLKLLAAMQGQLGVELAREHQPDLILLDLHLPDIMGDVVLDRLKSDASTAHIPVVMLTADATPAQEARLLAAGANDYLTKPVDVPRLLRVIEEMLSSRGRRELKHGTE